MKAAREQVRNFTITHKRKLLWIIVLIIVLPIAFVVLDIIYYFVRNYVEEQIINQKFHAEVKQYPQIHVNNFMLWEGDSRVDITIKNKGRVTMWYGVDGVPRIEYIGNFGTMFGCFYVDKNGKNQESAYTTDLWLDKTSPYKKWFSFEVNTLGDLVNHYDDITKILTTFPISSPESMFVANNEKHIPNPKYQIKNTFWNRPVVCNLSVAHEK
jgi:hypothetical protein